VRPRLPLPVRARPHPDRDRLRSLLRACILALGCALSLLSVAGDSELVQRRAELEQVQRRIAELEKALADAQASRSDAAGKLAAAERAVSAAARRLRQTGDDRVAAEKELAAQEAERLQVEGRISSRQAELADWLRRHYMHGGNDMAPFLSGRDPNQIARDARYLELVGRARLELIESLRADLRELERLVASIGAKRDGLVAIEAEQRRQQAELQKVQRARAGALEVLNRQIGERRKSRFRPCGGTRKNSGGCWR
jgi:murein hydrolase activator